MAMEIAQFFFGAFTNLSSSVGKSRNDVSGISRFRLSTVSAVHVPIRMFMQLGGLGSVLTLVDFPGLAAPVPEMKEPEVISVQDVEAPKWREDSSYYCLAIVLSVAFSVDNIYERSLKDKDDKLMKGTWSN